MNINEIIMWTKGKVKNKNFENKKIKNQIKKEEFYKKFIYNSKIRNFVFGKYHNKIVNKTINCLEKLVKK